VAHRRSVPGLQTESGEVGADERFGTELVEGPALLGFSLLRVGGRMRSGNQLPAAGIGDSQIA